MRGALDIFGLALVLLSILVVGPYVKSFTEGFAESPEAQQQATREAAQEAVKKQAEEIKTLGEELTAINKLLENPTLDESTRAKIIKEKEDLDARMKKLAGEVPKEGFQPFVPSSLEAFETFR